MKHLKEWQKHIQHPNEVDNYNESICGQNLDLQWHYLDIGHAFVSAPKDRLQPCPDCARLVVEVFNNAISETPA